MLLEDLELVTPFDEVDLTRPLFLSDLEAIALLETAERVPEAEESLCDLVGATPFVASDLTLDTEED